MTERQLIRRILRCWARVQEHGFELGRLIGLFHQRYSRQNSYRYLARRAREWFGRELNRETLRLHHRGYLLAEAAKVANQFAILRDVPLTHWGKAGVFRGLPDATKLRILRETKGQSLGRLRDRLIAASGERIRRRLAAAPVARAPRLAPNRVLNCKAAQLLPLLAENFRELVRVRLALAR